MNDWPRDRFVDAAELDRGLLLAAIQTKGDASCVVADFCGTGRCDILLAPAGEPPMLLQNVTPGGHWIELDLVGARKQDNKARSNSSAIGARVEIRTGTLFQQYMVGGSSGPVAMPPLRVHAGLGDNSKVEWLRILWPDGVLQAEIDVPADRVTRIEELPRKVSSCPALFAWDGSHYQFVSDFGGTGGLGYLVAPGQYAPPRPAGVRPPAAARADPRRVRAAGHRADGRSGLLRRGEADRRRSSGRHGGLSYRDDGGQRPAAAASRSSASGRPIEPVRAMDHRGVDVTDQLRRLDRRYAGATELDERFTGFAKDHFVDLDFGDRLKDLRAGHSPGAVPPRLGGVRLFVDQLCRRPGGPAAEGAQHSRACGTAAGSSCSTKSVTRRG